MATPPTWVSFGSSAFNVSTTPKTVSVTTQVGDRVVVVSLAEAAFSGAVNTAPTGGSQTYTQVATLGTLDTHARAIAWTMTSTTAATFSISAVIPANNATMKWGVMAWVYRGSDGFGTVGAPAVNSTSNLVTLTTTGANSALVVASADYATVDGTTRTRRTVNSSTGAEELYGRDSVAYTWYGQRYDDTGVVGSVTGGYSAPVGQTTATIAVEILGSGATPASIPPILVMATRR